MKICRIVPAYSPYPFGGADIYAEKISRQLVARGHNAVIITINPHYGYSYEEDHATKIYRFHPCNVSNVHKIGKQTLLNQGIWSLLDIYSPYSYYQVRNILKKERPDIVHVHTPVDFTVSVFDAVKSLRLPLVHTLHDFFLLCKRVTLLHANGTICTPGNMNPLCDIYRKIYRNIVNKNVDVVISPSEFTLTVHKQNGFFQNTEAQILPHGIDLSSCQDKYGREHSGKKSFDILYAGGLTKHKGVHVLIKAFKAITNPDIRLHIVGGGLYENELRILAQGDSRIVFRGKFPHKDMTKFYQDSDILVVPSVCYDVRPNVIPEAYTQGLPIIGSDIGGIPEFVIDNQTGFLFKQGDSRDLQRILEQVINNPQSLKQLSKNAISFVQQFEMGMYLDKLADIYRRTIEISNRKNG